METTNFFSSAAALNITGDLQVTVRKGAESNWIVSVIYTRRIGIPFPIGGTPLRREAVQPLVQLVLSHKSIALVFGQQTAASIVMLLL